MLDFLKHKSLKKAKEEKEAFQKEIDEKARKKGIDSFMKSGLTKDQATYFYDNFDEILLTAKDVPHLYVEKD